MTGDEIDAPESAIVESAAGPEHAGMRLDAYLAAAVPGLSRARAQKAIESGDVSVNGVVSKASHKLRAGDRIEFELPEPPVTEIVPEPIPLSILYRDEDLLVVDKPAGLVVHPGAGIASGTLANGLVYLLGQDGPGPAWRPGIVHRLDKDTSGLLVVALTPDAHTALAGQFQDRTVTKRYLTLVYGRMASDSGRFDQPIERHPKARVKMAVAPVGRGRPALTLFTVRERFPEASFLEVEIRTGRTHQIRVHLSAAGHPVVADEVYGTGRSTNIQDVRLRRQIATLGRQFLHAAHLAFDHPRTGERVTFNSPLPEPLRGLLEDCRARAR